MVPPWTPDPLPPQEPGNGKPEPADESAAPKPDGDPAGHQLPLKPTPPQAVPLAPSGRFGPARTSLGRFAKSGSTAELRKGIGRYVSKGLGGSKTAARRLNGTARSAGSLYGALSALANGQSTEALDRALLSGRSASEIMGAVVEAVRPIDGTQDAEATRNAIKAAASELLDKNPDADLLALSEAERLFVVERFLAIDIYNHLVLDLGQAIQKHAPTALAASARFREIKNYVKQAVSASFRKIHKSGETLSARRVSAISRQCIQEAMEVFEGGAE